MKYIKSRINLLTERMEFTKDLSDKLFKLKDFIDNEHWEDLLKFINDEDNTKDNKKIKKDVMLDLDKSNEYFIDLNTDRTWRVSKVLQTMLPNMGGAKIDLLTNKLKGIIRDEEFNRFEVITGEDISYYYQTNSYVSSNRPSSLHNSCMNNKHLTEIYENCDKCSLLILKSEDDEDKILGRALIWETNFGILMDRVYTVFKEDDILFELYSNKNKWYRKYDNSATNGIIVDYKNNPKRDIFEVDIHLDVRLNEMYAFLDIFKYYIVEESKIVNKIKDTEYGKSEEDGSHNYTIFNLGYSDAYETGYPELIQYSNGYVKEKLYDFIDNHHYDDELWRNIWTSFNENGDFYDTFFYDLFTDKKEFIENLISEVDEENTLEDLELEIKCGELNQFNVEFIPEPRDYRNVGEIVIHRYGDDEYIELNFSKEVAYNHIIKHKSLFNKLLYLLCM